MYKIKFKDGNEKEFETLRGADLRDADLGGANLEGADLGGANLEDAYLGDADLRGANLRGADLGGVNLEGADLRGVNLRGVNLEGADLRGVNLEGADLENTSVYSFTLGKHFGFYHEGYLKIGCEGHSIEHWVENVERIGAKHEYTEAEIRRYKRMIGLLMEEQK